MYVLKHMATTLRNALSGFVWWKLKQKTQIENTTNDLKYTQNIAMYSVECIG